MRYPMRLPLFSPFGAAFALGASLLLLTAPAALAQLNPTPANPAPLGPPDTVQLKSGVRYVTTVPGTGERPAAGQKVWVHYTGRLTDGHIFDTSNITGKPLKFTVGAQQVIPGVDQVVAVMKVGQKVTAFIPAALGYGPVGQPDDAEEGGNAYRVPPNADTVFELELVRVAK